FEVLDHPIRLIRGENLFRLAFIEHRALCHPNTSYLATKIITTITTIRTTVLRIVTIKSLL
ncbi:MAG TPA: hypothetical protein VFS68_08525, partial [Candidatus Udaeobacter sp.]|nr:hypothetical protein [Candidatus Udaeobacter sp.]